jgi:diguanylate cyclase (GGDEF)-like protein/PAS domain S-box-containing protein
MGIFIFMRLEKEKKVTKAALELNKITNSIRAGLVHFVFEDSCRILYASRGFYDLLGYSKQEVREENKLSILDFIDPKDTEALLATKDQLGNDTLNLEIRMITKSGQILYALVNGNSVLGRDGKHTISAVFVDISEQKQMQEMLLLEGERYRIASELSKDVLFEYHIRSDEMNYTDKFKDLFGRNPIIPSFNGGCDSRRELVHPDDWGIYLEFCQELAEGKRMIEAEFRMKDRMNEFIWCQAMGKTIYDDEKRPIRVIGKIVNVDSQKRELEALEYKATRDPLTGVYNKEVTIKKIDKYINGNRNGKHILMFIDFDDFKKVNDNFGHLLGDKILIYVIARIKALFTEGEIIGRIGGDEFVVFAGGISNMEDIMGKAEALVKALDTIYHENNMLIPISGSIGIATYPEDGMHYEQLIQCADKALYRVKEHGKNNYLLYNPSI